MLGCPRKRGKIKFLETTRKFARSLRTRVETHNAQVGLPETGLLRVVVYAGQTVLGLEDEDEVETETEEGIEE